MAAVPHQKRASVPPGAGGGLRGNRNAADTHSYPSGFWPFTEPAFDILRWLRAEPRFKQVPVFVLAPQSVDVNEAYALGANSCFIRNQRDAELEPIMDGIAAYASLIGERA